MVEIVENLGNDEVVLQQIGKVVVAAEEEKKTQKLRVLLIDDNVVCLAVMSSQLRHWGFEVTPKREALKALDLLRRNRNAFDIVFTDVVRFDLNGFHLSEIIKHQFGIPVIMISAKDDQRYIEEGMRCGATYYLVKPMQLEVLQAVCELVIRNLPNNNNNNNLADPLTLEPSYFADVNENPNTKQYDDDNDRDVDNDDDDENKKKKKKKDGHVSSSSGESSSTIQKKPRVVWDARLHQKFVEAVLRLDVEKVVPKKILEMMNEPNLTRENIASHLQKFRNVLRKEWERLCQERAKNPREALQLFLNPTVQPPPVTPGLTLNFNNFCSGQEMIRSSSTNFNQQRSLYSVGNHFSQHHHLHQQQLIKNMATTESSRSSSLSKTSEPRKTFFMEMEYPTIHPQAAALPNQEISSASSSSSSRGNNIGCHHHHHQAARPPTNVQPFQVASGGDVVPYQARAPTNVQPYKAVVGAGGGDVVPYQARAPTNVQSFQVVVGVGSGDVVPYQARAPTNVQSFQAVVGGGGGDVVPHHARTPANVQLFQSFVGGVGDHVVPYQTRPPTNVQPFQAASGGGGDVPPYEVRPPTNVQPFQAGDGSDVVVPYQIRPTNVQPSQVGGDGDYGTGSSADKGNKVHLSSSIDNHIVHNYYHEYNPNTMELQPSSQSASDYSIGGNNNDGYLMLPPIISSNIVLNQASSFQPNNSLEESINNSIVPYQAMPTLQLFQPNTSVEESINNSIVPNQATPTQQSYQATDFIGGFMDNSVVLYQAMPTQQPSQPSSSFGGSIDDSIVGHQAMPSQANTSVEGSIVPYLAGSTQELSQPIDSIVEFFDNSFVPYQTMPTHQPFQPTDSIKGFIDNSIAPYQAWPTQPNTSLEESIDNSIIPYQAWPTQELSQPTDYFGGSIDFIVPYQAWHTQNSSHLSGSIGGNSGENNGHLLPSINSMVLYQDEHTKHPAQEISSFGGNSGQVGYTQPYITDHSSSFSSLFFSPDENSYFNENKYDYCMQLLPTGNTNADPIHDTSFVGENINGYDHQMMNPLPAADFVAEVSSNNIDDLSDEEIIFMINELSNYGTPPSIS